VFSDSVPLWILFEKNYWNQHNTTNQYNSVVIS
jgi:hypothetical protein